MKRITIKKLIAVAAPVIAAIIALLLGLNNPGETSNTSSPKKPTTTASAPAGSELAYARDTLASMKSAGKVRDKRCATAKITKDRDKSCVVPAYNRTKQFGPDWGGSGKCWNTRDIVLRDQLDNVKSSSCNVLSGVLTKDPYTGEKINFKRGKGTSLAVQIDHLYPLGLAWSMGAADWPQAKRVNFANEVGIHLIASDGPTNVVKSDKSLAEWVQDKNVKYPARIPDKPTECALGMRYLNVAHTYGLSILTSDYDYLNAMFSGSDCAQVPGNPATAKSKPAI